MNTDLDCSVSGAGFGDGVLVVEAHFRIMQDVKDDKCERTLLAWNNYAQRLHLVLVDTRSNNLMLFINHDLVLLSWACKIYCHCRFIS